MSQTPFLIHWLKSYIQGPTWHYRIQQRATTESVTDNVFQSTIVFHFTHTFMMLPSTRYCSVVPLALKGSHNFMCNSYTTQLTRNQLQETMLQDIFHPCLVSGYQNCIKTSRDIKLFFKRIGANIVLYKPQEPQIDFSVFIIHLQHYYGQ